MLCPSFSTPDLNSSRIESGSVIPAGGTRRTVAAELSAGPSPRSSNPTPPKASNKRDRLVDPAQDPIPELVEYFIEVALEDPDPSPWIKSRL